MIAAKDKNALHTHIDARTDIQLLNTHTVLNYLSIFSANVRYIFTYATVNYNF